MMDRRMHAPGHQAVAGLPDYSSVYGTDRINGLFLVLQIRRPHASFLLPLDGRLLTPELIKQPYPRQGHVMQWIRMKCANLTRGCFCTWKVRGPSVRGLGDTSAAPGPSARRSHEPGRVPSILVSLICCRRSPEG